MSNYQTWMAVERLENWEADRATDFKRFGIPYRARKRAQNVRKDDLIVAYVSSAISCFADIRRVTTPTIEKLGFDGGYDDVFPFCIRTEGVLALDREAWVPIRGMLNDLSFTKGKTDWRQTMRNSFRLLGEHDAIRIVQAMEHAAHSRNS